MMSWQGAEPSRNPNGSSHARCAVRFNHSQHEATQGQNKRRFCLPFRLHRGDRRHLRLRQPRPVPADGLGSNAKSYDRSVGAASLDPLGLASRSSRRLRKLATLSHRGMVMYAAEYITPRRLEHGQGARDTPAEVRTHPAKSEKPFLPRMTHVPK